MSKIIIGFLFLLLTSFTYADKNQCGDIKMKATKVSKQKIEVIILTKVDHKFRYMTHLLVKRGKDILYDTSMSRDIFSTQLIKFKIFDTGDENSITGIASFNTGEVEECFVKIDFKAKNFLNTLGSQFKIDTEAHNYHNIRPKVWNAMSFDDAIKLFYGDTKLISAHNNMFFNNYLHELPTNNPMRLNIKSVKDMESLMILATGKKGVVKAIIRIPNSDSVYHRNETISIDVPSLSFKRSADVTVVYRMRNGKVYRQEIPTQGGWSIESDNEMPTYHIELLEE